MKQFKERIKNGMAKIKENLANFWKWYLKCLDKHYYITLFITSLPFAAILQIYIELCLKK